MEDCQYDCLGTIVCDFDKRVNPSLHSFYAHVFKLMKSNVHTGMFPIHSIEEMRYYIVKDSIKILSIHKTIESSKVTFDLFVKNGSYETYIELIGMTTCEFGLVEETALAYFHSKADSHTIAHVQIQY